MNRSARDYELDADKNCVRCESCGKEMTVVIARGWAKSSRKTRSFDRRYQTRIMTHLGEQELYIEDALSDNLAFRSGDWHILSIKVRESF